MSRLSEILYWRVSKKPTAIKWDREWEGAMDTSTSSNGNNDWIIIIIMKSKILLFGQVSNW